MAACTPASLTWLACGRELAEEVGLTQFALGALVWRRQHTFDWEGRRLCQRERYYIIETPAFDPVMRDAVEARVVEAMRWWRLATSQRPTRPSRRLRWRRSSPATDARGRRRAGWASKSRWTEVPCIPRDAEMTTMFDLARCFLLVCALASCARNKNDSCKAGQDCADGLVCLLWEDSREGSCLPKACTEDWTGYGCSDTGDTG